MSRNLPKSNRLSHESSPYLLQHAHNPVDWYPWGEEAIEKAKSENKMLIISIGYSACHWCHVMEHQSFEDEEVAAIMNEHFVSIKVDREERPDVDQVYMDAVQLITGQGGWPLNAFALPDGRPFYAGTYFPKEHWIQVLNFFIENYKNNPGLLQEQAEKVVEGIDEISKSPVLEDEALINDSELEDLFSNFSQHLDYKKGGLARAPKFPMPSIWEFLLHYSHQSGNKEAEKITFLTLDKMAEGGIYDHLGGGFARYSVDADWHAPHFEKMLYDNAQLVSLYAHAYQKSGNALYKEIINESLDFIKRELSSPGGGFYSALDADSEGVEGKFYTWTYGEVEKLLGSDTAIFADYYMLSKEGNWEEGQNILHRYLSGEAIASRHSISEEELMDIITRSREKLFQEREKRVRPGLDNKILTSWNALMLKAYVDAYRALNTKEYLDSALKNAEFLMENMITPDGEIFRSYKNGKVSIAAFLDDYAFVISAFISLYQACFDEKWLHKARKITDYALKNFADANDSLLFYKHEQHDELIIRKKERHDQVIPSSNSQMAINLYMLGHYLSLDKYLQKSEKMLALMIPGIKDNIYSHANWAQLALALGKENLEIAVSGKHYLEFRAALDQEYLPFALFLGSEHNSELELLKNRNVENQTTIYVCRNKSCSLPVNSVENALKLIG